MARIVVAGASRGIGAAVVAELGRRGHDVVGTTRDRLELADPGSIRAFAATVGPVDVLVANAAVALDGFDAGVAAKTLR
jgi:short-subunit dehydrogenase